MKRKWRPFCAGNVFYSSISLCVACGWVHKAPVKNQIRMNQTNKQHELKREWKRKKKLSAVEHEHIIYHITVGTFGTGYWITFIKISSHSCHSIRPQLTSHPWHSGITLCTISHLCKKQKKTNKIGRKNYFVYENDHNNKRTGNKTETYMHK